MPVSSWVKAARPRTLSLSLMPVLVGAALAWTAERKLYPSAVLAALFASMCIQLGTNLHNDASDSERGGDGADRLGPARVTASGLLAAYDVKRGACACFGLAGTLGIYLVALGGWPILLLGILSILSGWAYTGGPLPIAYTPFGELFVLAFFGVGAVCGTYWLSAGDLRVAPLLGGIAMGLFESAVLLVNNTRDMKEDARIGRRTLAITAGRPMTNVAFVSLVLAPFALLPFSRSVPTARPRLDRICSAAIRRNPQLPFYPRAARPRVQPTACADGAGAAFIWAIDLSRIVNLIERGCATLRDAKTRL